MRIASTHDENDGRVVGLRPIGQSCDPAIGDEAVLVHGLDIRGQTERDDIGLQFATGDQTSLVRRATVRLSDRDGLAGFLLKVCGESRVDLLVKFPRWIVRDVQ